jgi:hypothetical protein
LTIDDIAVLAALNEVAIALDEIIVIMSQQQAAPDNDYDNYYVNYAINNGMALQQSTSKYLVPFPSGANLEQLAVQYLNDIDRWPEIAALNALQEPYVDEVGYTIPFSTDGTLNFITVTDPMKLFVGQVIQVSSRTQPTQSFQINQIEILSQYSTLIQLNQGDDVSGYTVQDVARILAYLPNTVNSTKLIAIPSDSTSQQTTMVRIGPNVSDLNGLAQIAQTDFLLTSSGDFVVTPGGNIGRASGYTNLVQACFMHLKTIPGSMLQHPGWGNPLQAGISVADLSVAQVFSVINQSFQQDQRFQGILGGQINLNGPSAPMSLLIGINGTNMVLPISTQPPPQI